MYDEGTIAQCSAPLFQQKYMKQQVTNHVTTLRLFYVFTISLDKIIHLG